jgi:hypothetical protein
MGSLYDAGGRRWDHHLFLDHDGRYERTVRRGPDYERRDAGRWEYREAEGVLRLEPDTRDDSDRMSGEWWVLSVSTCEDSNVLLVLREAVLASRNLPILFYRVHCHGRGYGTGWEERLTQHRT